MIDEGLADLEDQMAKKMDEMMQHTHVVEHSERVLFNEDGTSLVVDTGPPLRGIKLADQGKESSELWQRVTRLDAVVEAVRRRLEEQESAARRSSRNPSRAVSPTRLCLAPPRPIRTRPICCCRFGSFPACLPRSPPHDLPLFAMYGLPSFRLTSGRLVIEVAICSPLPWASRPVSSSSTAFRVFSPPR